MFRILILHSVRKHSVKMKLLPGNRKILQKFTFNSAEFVTIIPETYCINENRWALHKRKQNITKIMYSCLETTQSDIHTNLCRHMQEKEKWTEKNKVTFFLTMLEMDTGH